MQPIADLLRQAMRHWTTGVSVVTSQFEGHRHGMTVNTFTSISLEPPVVVVTLANRTRTCQLVQASGIFGVTILSEEQGEISDRFAGRVPDGDDRFHDLSLFSMKSGAPLLEGGLAFLDCQVVHTYSMPNSTLFVGEVLAARYEQGGNPLVYLNRKYHRVNP
jgi:flavin reductase (DIM6/NTAB) family NADH-FMN oxidoreductase RutF